MEGRNRGPCPRPGYRVPYRCFLSARYHSRAVSWWRSSDDGKGHRNVAPGGVGVRADLVGPGDELFRGWPVDVRDAYLEVDGEAEPSAVELADADAGDDLAAVDVELVLPA